MLKWVKTLKCSLSLDLKNLIITKINFWTSSDFSGNSKATEQTANDTIRDKLSSH